MLRLPHLLLAVGATALIVAAIATRGRLPWRSPLVLVPSVLVLIGWLALWRGPRRR